MGDKKCAARKSISWSEPLETNVHTVVLQRDTDDLCATAAVGANRPVVAWLLDQHALPLDGVILAGRR